MNNFNLRDMAIEILRIDQQFYNILGGGLYHKGIRQCDYDLKVFDQLWGNTSGGFQGVGGSAMTTQKTYVFIPNHNMDDKDMCFVFFGGTFAYRVPYSKEFMDDVNCERVLGKSEHKKYYDYTVE
jgi:hypothetical protein